MIIIIVYKMRFCLAKCLLRFEILFDSVWIMHFIIFIIIIIVEEFDAKLCDDDDDVLHFVFVFVQTKLVASVVAIIKQSV